MKTLAAALLAVTWAGLATAQTVSPSPPSPAAPEMTTYYMVMLVKGPKWTAERSPALEQLQKDHLGHLRAMHAAGKLVLAGPLTDGGTIRGLAVYKVASLDEARTLAEADPAVKAGRMAVEVHPWMVQKGILP